MPIKPIIIPKENIKRAKFVQVYFFENGLRMPVLRYDNSLAVNHSIILADLLSEKGLAYKKMLIGGSFCPRLEEKGRYELCGAGRLEVKDELFAFWGCSADYELRPNEQHLTEIQKIEPQFRFRIDKHRFS